jgi:hypothetical protein
MRKSSSLSGTFNLPEHVGHTSEEVPRSQNSPAQAKQRRQACAHLSGSAFATGLPPAPMDSAMNRLHPEQAYWHRELPPVLPNDIAQQRSHAGLTFESRKPQFA